MGIVYGQPPFFSYEGKFFRPQSYNKNQYKFKKQNFGNIITIESDHYIKRRRYNRRYLFNYNAINNMFILEDIHQGPKSKRGYAYRPSNVFDTSFLNQILNNQNFNSNLNTSAPVFDTPAGYDVPPGINNAFLHSIFNCPSEKYLYFLDCIVTKRIPWLMNVPYYYRSNFDISEYCVSFVRFGLANLINRNNDGTIGEYSIFAARERR